MQSIDPLGSNWYFVTIEPSHPWLWHSFLLFKSFHSFQQMSTGIGRCTVLLFLFFILSFYFKSWSYYQTPRDSPASAFWGCSYIYHHIWPIFSFNGYFLSFNFVPIITFSWIIWKYNCFLCFALASLHVIILWTLIMPILSFFSFLNLHDHRIFLLLF